MVNNVDIDIVNLIQQQYQAPEIDMLVNASDNHIEESKSLQVRFWQKRMEDISKEEYFRY